MATATSHPPPGPSYQYPQAPPLQYQQQQLQQQQQQQVPPPQQNPSAQQRSSQPSRKSRSFSFRSDKSHGSSNHNYKLDLTETSAEKEANRLHSKADPTLAMQEAEPAEVAAFVKSSLASLRNLQHKDIYGNPISEPDRSNPTRSRWERPLDTIRSFEAAIDGGYNNRRSMIRPDPDSNNNRRQSYYGGGSGTGGRFSHDSYYGSRPQSLMYADRVGGSHQDLRSMNHRDAYYDYQSGHNGHGPPPNSRQRWPRMQSEPQYGYNRQHQGEYTLPSNYRSYETVTTASGSGTSGEPSGYHTDPTSSDNSSIERIHSASKRQPEPMNDYGIGFSQSTPYQPPSFMVGTQSSSSSTGDLNNYQVSSALNGSAQPPQPPKMNQRGSILRKPMAPTPVLTSTIDHVQQRPSPPEKRKSWLSRRFSKTR